MRKLVLGLFLSFAAASMVFANSIDVGQVNSQIKKVLSPFQNQNTIVNLTFTDINLTDERVEKVAVNAQYFKKAANNHFNLKLDNIEYDYNDGVAPKTVMAGSLGIDLTKMLSQEDINELIPQLVEYVDNMFETTTDQEYGDALNFSGAVTSTSKDAQGNYQGLTALFAATVDFSKLPEETPLEDVFFKSFALSVSLNVHEGLSFQGYVISNPDYKSFKEDEEGLTEFLKKLAANDPDEMRTIFQTFMMVDTVVSSMLEGNNLGKFIPKLKVSHQPSKSSPVNTPKK
jgi:hypothetical protein